MPKDKGIRLDPDRGINPRMTTCSQCGADTNELALLGNNDHVLECDHCRTKVLGTVKQKKCPRCKTYALRHVRRLDDFEKIPMGLCPPCDDKRKKSEEMVRQGGILWRCDACGAQGAIRAGHPLAEEVRKKLNIAPPHTAGVTFHKDSCPVCTPIDLGETHE